MIQAEPLNATPLYSFPKPVDTPHARSRSSAITTRFVEREQGLMDILKELIVPQALMARSGVPFNQYWPMQSSKLSNFMELLATKENLSASFLFLMKELYDNAYLIAYHFHQLLDDLSDSRYASIELSMDVAKMLRRGLSVRCHEALVRALEQNIASCDEGDICRYALMAFLRCLKGESKDDSEDQSVLNSFRQLQQTFPSLARKLSNRLQAYWSSNELHTEWLGYGPMGGSLQKTLVALLTENDRVALRQSLLSRLQRLLEMPQFFENLAEMKAHWKHYQVWVHFFNQITEMNQEGLENHLKKLSYRSIIGLQNPIFFDYTLRCALFIRLFGDKRQQVVLDQWLLKKIVQLPMMLLEEQNTLKKQCFLEKTEPLVSLVGTSNQVQHINQVLRHWSAYHRGVISKEQMVKEVITPSLLQHACESIRACIQDGLNQYAVLSEEGVNNLRLVLRRQLAMHQLPLSAEYWLEWLPDVSKNKKMGWFRRFFCESSESYALYGLLMLSKLHAYELYIHQGSHIKELVAALVIFSESLKHRLSLGRLAFPRMVHKTIRQCGR